MFELSRDDWIFLIVGVVFMGIGKFGEDDLRMIVSALGIGLAFHPLVKIWRDLFSAILKNLKDH